MTFVCFVCIFSGFSEGFRCNLKEYLEGFFPLPELLSAEEGTQERSDWQHKSVTSLRMSHEISYSTCIPHCCWASFTHTVVTLQLWAQQWRWWSGPTLDFAPNYLGFGVCCALNNVLEKTGERGIKKGCVCGEGLSHHWVRHAYGYTRGKLSGAKTYTYTSHPSFPGEESTFPLTSSARCRLFELMQLYLRHYEAGSLKLNQWIVTSQQHCFALGSI